MNLSECPTNDLCMVSFEAINTEAYRLLLRIEVTVRELLRVELERNHGSNWYKQLPGELLKKIRQSQQEESRPQFDYLRLGPLYYLTLGELLPLLQQKSGQSAANRLGGERITEQISNVLSPRNAVAHSRSVSVTGLQCIRALYQQIENALTPTVIQALMASPDIGVRPEDVIEPLIVWLDTSLDYIRRLSG